MQFQVPQFIEVEDKIFGPLTFKQFIYLAGGVGIAFVIYTVLPLFLAIIFIIPIVGLSLALAFYKINNKPFIQIMESALKYTINSKLYVWKKEKNISKKETVVKKIDPNMYVPKLSDSKLKDLSWSLDVHKKIQ
jgi:hypothetical protein